MSDVERFRAELVEFLERELPAKLGELPPPTADYWGGRTPELPDELASGRALAFGNGKAKYALLETPYHHLPYYLRDIVFLFGP